MRPSVFSIAVRAQVGREEQSFREAGEAQQAAREIIARANDIKAALSADLAKPGRSPYASEVEVMWTAIDDALAHLEE